MAHRINYRKVLRQIHLVFSMIILAYLLMYFVTAFIGIRPQWFPHEEPKVTREIVTFKTEPGADYSKLYRQIKKQLNITGRTDKPLQQKNGTWVYAVYKPGLGYRIVYNPDKHTLDVTKTEQKTVGRIASRLHMMRHYSGGVKYIIWSVFYDLAAFSMLAFGVTGILIWLKMGKAYRTGIYYLLAGFAITIAVILWLTWF